MPDGSLINYGTFIDLVENNKNIESYGSIDEGYSVVIPFDYSIQTLVNVFSFLKKNISIIVTNPTQQNIEKTFYFANGSQALNEASNKSKPYNILFNKSRKDEDSLWLSSSGITNRPKFWSHNCDSLTWNINEYCDVFSLDEQSFFWTAFPPHSISFWKAIFVLVNCSGKILHMQYPTGLDAINLFKTTSAHNITSMAFPPVYAEIMIAIQQRGIGPLNKSIKRILCGGDYLSEKVYKEFEKTFQLRPNIIYGLTESAGPIMYVKEDQWAPGSIGSMFKGSYYVEDNNKSGSLVLEGGFLSRCIEGSYKTNDVIDISKGYPRFMGRNSDWISCNGQRVSLLEAEEALLKHQNVKSVRIYSEQKKVEDAFSDLEAGVSIEIVLKDKSKAFAKNEIITLLGHSLSINKIDIVDKISRHTSSKIVRLS